MPLPDEAKPRPVTPESIMEGAGLVAPHSTASDPLRAVLAAVQRVERTDLLELAQECLGKPIVDEKGQPRQQSHTELIVLVVAYFGRWINELEIRARGS